MTHPNFTESDIRSIQSTEQSFSGSAPDSLIGFLVLPRGVMSVTDYIGQRSIFLDPDATGAPQPASLAQYEDETEISAWINETFGELERRVNTAPSQELLEAADALLQRLENEGFGEELPDDWVEHISEAWSKLRD